ncbi:MAG: aspartate-semialdehyde dehydrogenase [Spirochaetes bacterium]|nr:aspartate-semialdehyde dehydrogenase [Spirochaetota bacterium]
MLKVGFVGWRGMVGSVLINRMKEENDFKGFEPFFFSTSQAGKQGPDIGIDIDVLKDAHNLDLLKKLDIIITCQGSDYTAKIYPELKKVNWKGYWIDAASKLRMLDEAVIILDPVNLDIIKKGLKKGIKAYIGGNCTVSLMLMALQGLFKNKCIEWLSTMTYQAASGSGVKLMTELVNQMKIIGDSSRDTLKESEINILELDRIVTNTIRNSDFPIEYGKTPLAASLIPWIDSCMDSGQTREEWKGSAETNKILMTKKFIPVDGICVRVSSMRCHSQALTIKLTKDIPLNEIEDMIKSANEWVKVIPNNYEDTIRELTPAKVSGTLSVPIGRLRKMMLGNEYLTGFTVGDQLLWGAAEPLRRMLRIILDEK